MKIFLLVGIILLLLIVYNFVMSRVFKVESSLFTYYDHVNDTHKFIDRTLRIVFVLLMFIGLFIHYRKDFVDPIWYLEPHYLLIFHTILSELMRSYMQWKHEKNRNEFKFTLSQLAFAIVLLFIVL